MLDAIWNDPFIGSRAFQKRFRRAAVKALTSDMMSGPHAFSLVV